MKQVLTTCTDLSRFCFLETTPVLAPNMWADEKIPELTPVPGNRTWNLKIARQTLYLTTTDTTNNECFKQCKINVFETTIMGLI